MAKSTKAKKKAAKGKKKGKIRIAKPRAPKRRPVKPTTVKVAEPRTGNNEPALDIARSQTRIGSNVFTLDVARRMPKNGNYFVSPFNIRTALAMLYAGARKGTAGEMAKVLGFPEEQKFLHLQLSNLKEKLEATGILKMANSVWVDDGQPVELLFQKVMEEMYKAKMGIVNFEGNPEGCRAAINRWVEEATSDKIKNLMGDGSVTIDTKMVLVAAIHFKDMWKTAFSPDDTQEEDFFSPGGTVKTPFMSRVANFGYAKGPGYYKILEMPYKSGLSMFIILPHGHGDLPVIEKDLLSGKIELPRELAKPEVRVTFPKFKVEYGFPAADMLKQMGMPLAFSDDADFSGISKGKDALKVDSVIHKAFCEVNEEGTEAAAATAVVMMKCTSFTPEPEPEIFRADHPFLYMIRENVEGNILFIGRMENPKG